MCDCESKTLCGKWTSKQSMLTERELFAAASGPDSSATSPTEVDSDPRVYVMGGIKNGTPLAECEKYNPHLDQWIPIQPLPEPMGYSSGSFVPDYSVTKEENLGYIYVLSHKFYQYNIKKNLWSELSIPFQTKNASLQYLDDVGGPLVQLFILLGLEPPSCSDGQTLWVVGGEGTEQETWFVNLGINGLIEGEWSRGPDLPLYRKNPLVGRTFWRDTGITYFGVSNCATILVAGGYDENDYIKRDVQILVRENCNWVWVNKYNNNTKIPDQSFKLKYPVADGAFGTEQWPETLITGGRPILFGGIPTKRNQGTVQYTQLRFVRGKYRFSESKNDKWKLTTSMPAPRTNFRALPLSQENSSDFGGNRVSRFLCVGGSADGKSLNRVQLFELPTPSL